MVQIYIKTTPAPPPHKMLTTLKDCITLLVDKESSLTISPFFWFVPPLPRNFYFPPPLF